MTDSVLISLRNFDMVSEVNYTAQKGEPSYRNITWFYSYSVVFRRTSSDVRIRIL